MNGPEENLPQASQKPLTPLQYVLLSIGWICVVLGVIGIFLPLLPTTPFLLLAAACFVRSSPRVHRWLLQHPKLGKYLDGYIGGKGLPVKAKVYTILLMWVSMSISMLIVPISWVAIMLACIGMAVTVWIIRQPTRDI